MIAAWMLHAVAAAALLALAALAADAALRAMDRSTRWPWAAALLLSVALPPLAWWRATLDAPTATEVASPAAAGDARGDAVLDLLLARATMRVAPTSTWAALDRPLVALWAAGSLLALGRLASAQRRLRRARGEWRRAVVDRTPVLVAGRTGPAVAGVLRPAVVLPEWALGVDPALRRLMLAHEREHVRAGDPWILAAAAILAALLPWNPALWWQLRRLRLAVEIDCDRRVLRRHPDVARYGALLLEVGRRAPGPALPLAALTSPTSLERRIRTMTSPRPRHPFARGLALLGTSALVAAAALVVPQPTVATLHAQVTGAAPTAQGEIVERAREAVRAHLPELSTRTTGAPVTIAVVVDGDDRVVSVTQESVVARNGGATGAAKAGAIRGEARATGGLSDIEPASIASVEIVKLAPGRLLPDSTSLIWVRLKHGAERGASSVGGVGATPNAPRETAGARAEGGARRAATPDSAVTRVVRRGPGAIGAARPLYVLDGVVLGPDSAETVVRGLVPEKIESIEVIKGAAAANGYGDAGANGVIVITTKGGGGR